MEVNINESTSATVIYLNGSFDATVSRDVREKFDGLISKGLQNFIVDLEQVDFIDSSALGALVGFFKKVRVGEGDVKLARLSSQILKIFELTQLDQVFEILPWDYAKKIG